MNFNDIELCAIREQIDEVMSSNMDDEIKGCIVDIMINDIIDSYVNMSIIAEEDKKNIVKRKRQELVDIVNEHIESNYAKRIRL